MRKQGFTKIEAVVVLGIIIILAALLFPIFARTHCNDRRSSCQSNLRQIIVAFRMYLADYDEKYPLNQHLKYRKRHAKSDDTGGWAHDLKTYLGSAQPYYCPTRKALTPKATSYTDYYFNNRLASLDSRYLRRQASVILLGEGNDGKTAPTAGYAFSELPEQWRHDKNSPAYRHLNGANYAFADGHVKWLKPETITNEAPGKALTFRLR